MLLNQRHAIRCLMDCRLMLIAQRGVSGSSSLNAPWKRGQTPTHHTHRAKDLRDPDENVVYDPRDPRFLPGPSPREEAYWKYTDDEIVELTKLNPDGPWFKSKRAAPISTDTEPFNRVWQSETESKDFTGVRVIDDPEAWQWVEHYMPRPTPVREGVLENVTDKSKRPSGWEPPPGVPPQLPYFIARTRNGLYPIYKVLEKAFDGHKQSYWFTLWDKTGVDPRERQILSTTINFVKGDLWACEKDIRTHLEAETGEKVLTSVIEQRGKIEIRGDHIARVVRWVREKGF